MTREEAISRIENHIRIHSKQEPFRACHIQEALKMAIEALKAQDIATIQPKRIELADETKAWLDEMDAVDALGNIADICIDWDGYRTANELGGLINEIWAYARYCADKLLKAQETVEPKVVQDANGVYAACGKCNHKLWKLFGAEFTVAPSEMPRFCSSCGQKVKWE